MSKPGFEHHGRFTSVTARKMLSHRGGVASAKVRALNGYKALQDGHVRYLLLAKRERLLKQAATLDAEWVRVYGCTLLEYLLSTRNH